MSYQQQPQPYGAPADPAFASQPPSGRGREALFGVISALLILPTLIFHYANQELFTRLSGTGAQWASFGSFLGMYIYFALVVAFMGRTIARRLGAVAIGLLGAALSSGTYAMSIEDFQNYYDTFGSIENAIVPASSFLFVVAWGIARRQHPLWLIGLVPTVGILAFSEYLYFTPIFGRLNVGSDRDPATFLAYWANSVGSVVLAVLVCWGLDAVGRSLGNRSGLPQQQPSQPQTVRIYGHGYGYGPPPVQQEPKSAAPWEPSYQAPAPASDDAADFIESPAPAPKRPARFADEYDTGLEEPDSEPKPTPVPTPVLKQPAPPPGYPASVPAHFAPPDEPQRNAYGEIILPRVQQLPMGPGYGYGQQQPNIPPTYGAPTGG